MPLSCIQSSSSAIWARIFSFYVFLFLGFACVSPHLSGHFGETSSCSRWLDVCLLLRCLQRRCGGNWYTNSSTSCWTRKYYVWSLRWQISQFHATCLSVLLPTNRPIINYYIFAPLTCLRCRSVRTYFPDVVVRLLFHYRLIWMFNLRLKGTSCVQCYLHCVLVMILVSESRFFGPARSSKYPVSPCSFYGLLCYQSGVIPVEMVSMWDPPLAYLLFAEVVYTQLQLLGRYYSTIQVRSLIIQMSVISFSENATVLLGTHLLYSLDHYLGYLFIDVATPLSLSSGIGHQVENHYQSIVHPRAL